MPALLLTLIATGRISGALDRLQNPGVQRSVESAPRLYTEITDRWRTVAEPLLSALPAAYPEPGTEAVIRRLLEESGLGYAVWEAPGGADRAVYADPGRHGVREDGAPPAAAAVPEDLPRPVDWEQLHGDGSPPALRGRTLRFFRPGAGPGHGLAVGVVLQPDLAAAMESVGRDYARYLQLGPVEEIQKKLVWISSLAIFLLAAAAAFVIARATARRISRPVRELALATERVAAGDLSHRAAIDADGEIGDLVAAFNRMTGELEASRDELVRVERIAAWRDVARRIAHEVRNPLTPIKVAVHRLQSRLPEGDDSAAECLRSIGEEVENLARISGSFSEFAKFPEAEFAPCDAAAIARGVAELFGESTPGVRVTYEGDDAVPLVADRDQIRRAVTNLVKNAAEAMSEAGRTGVIRVRAATRDRRVLIEVCDDGPGIPAAIRDSLFRPGVSARTGGSGLGLAMVLRIATDHRGTLRWQDRKPGTCFELLLPRDPQETG